MRIETTRVLREAWTLFRGDADLLLRIAGPFLFLPVFALGLLVPGPPAASGSADGQAQSLAWIQSVSDWAGTYGGWYVAAYLIGYLGTATILALYIGEPRSDTRGALGRAIRIFPRFALATMVGSLPAGAGLLLWVLPGLYVLGRLLPVGPILLAEAPIGAWAAIRRSVVLTRGSGLVLTGLSAFAYLSGWLIGTPFLEADRILREGGHGNPVMLALVDAGAAIAAMGSGLATALIALTVYRRLAA